MLPRILVPQSAMTDGAAKPRVLLDPSHVGQGENVFGGALLETVVQKRKPMDWLISLGAHVALIAAVVIIPLLITQQMDLVPEELTMLTAPPPPMAPPPPLGAMHASPQKVYTVAKLTMPVSIPKLTKMAASAPEAAPDIAEGQPDGVAGGVLGGVVGGILGGTGQVTVDRPTVASAPNKPLSVGGQVKRPQLVYDPQPDYPFLAKQGQVQGDVQIDAVVDKNGDVVQVHALSGPPLLVAAALKAVEQWKYKPTILNGTPYPVELTVDVTFRLS